MFKADLQARLERIFQIPKTTYDAPSYDAPEQDTLFIDIADCVARTSAGAGGRATAKVLGSIVVFSQANRTPFGFFAKRIEQASLDDKRNLFFEREIDIPNSPARLQNLHERRVGFQFLYDAQYDPDRGELTSMTLSLEMED